MLRGQQEKTPSPIAKRFLPMYSQCFAILGRDPLYPTACNEMFQF